MRPKTAARSRRHEWLAAHHGKEAHDTLVEAQQHRDSTASLRPVNTYVTYDCTWHDTYEWGCDAQLHYHIGKKGKWRWDSDSS